MVKYAQELLAYAQKMKIHFSLPSALILSTIVFLLSHPYSSSAQTYTGPQIIPTYFTSTDKTWTTCQPNANPCVIIQNSITQKQKWTEQDGGTGSSNTLYGDDYIKRYGISTVSTNTTYPKEPWPPIQNGEASTIYTGAKAPAPRTYPVPPFGIDNYRHEHLIYYPISNPDNMTIQKHTTDADTRIRLFADLDPAQNFLIKFTFNGKGEDIASGNYISQSNVSFLINGKSALSDNFYIIMKGGTTVDITPSADKQSYQYTAYVISVETTTTPAFSTPLPIVPIQQIPITTSTPNQTSSPTPTASPVSNQQARTTFTQIPTNLFFLVPGSTGSDIVTLQNYLIQMGYLGIDNNTGYYGPSTVAAMARYKSDLKAQSTSSPTPTYSPYVTTSSNPLPSYTPIPTQTSAPIYYRSGSTFSQLPNPTPTLNTSPVVKPATTPTASAPVSPTPTASTQPTPTTTSRPSPTTSPNSANVIQAWDSPSSIWQMLLGMFNK